MTNRSGGDRALRAALPGLSPRAFSETVLRGLICFLVLPLVALAAESAFAGPTIAGQLASPPRLETSGLAASRRNPDLLWVHDDSGGASALYAVTTRGEAIGTLKIRGTKNEDWEDL